MNLELLDPFARKQYPELLETYVYEPGSFATLTRFNRRGTLLASGCHNGKIVIWDFMTRSKAATMHRVRALSFFWRARPSHERASTRIR
jgi:COMPASS component SWD1